MHIQYIYTHTYHPIYTYHIFPMMYMHIVMFHLSCEALFSLELILSSPLCHPGLVFLPPLANILQ